jgi:hypothetical protein
LRISNSWNNFIAALSATAPNPLRSRRRSADSSSPRIVYAMVCVNAGFPGANDHSRIASFGNCRAAMTSSALAAARRTRSSFVHSTVISMGQDTRE